MEKKEAKKINPLEKLRKIGFEKITEDTHILPSDIEAIIEKDFSKLNKTKAFGFIKILEREYKIDLSEWKKEYQEYLNSQKQHQQEIFVTVKEEDEEEKENKLFLIIGAIALIIIGYGTYYFFNNIWNTSPLTQQEIKTEKELKKQNTQTITQPEQELMKKETQREEENAQPKNSIQTAIENNETNLSNEENKIEENKTLTSTKEDNQTANQTPPEITNFIIEPKTKVWAGVIFLEDYSKKQFLTDQNISLDPSKDFLIITGHGKINIYLGNEKESFDEGKKLYFLYKDHSLEKIDAQTFKTINRGRKW